MEYLRHMESFEKVLALALFIIFFIIAHIAMPFLNAIGLKIEYVNHAPWPYKKMVKSILADFNNE